MRLEGLDPEPGFTDPEDGELGPMPDPEPEDGELGYSGPLKGGRDGMPDYHSEEAPGQVTLYELLEERDPPIDKAEELGLR